MTGKQIEKIRKEIPQFENGIPCELTPEQKRLHRELDCRDMISYGSSFLESRYSEPYIQELGKERVIELYNEQKTDFDKNNGLVGGNGPYSVGAVPKACISSAGQGR